ncbi:lytic transglycosylase [Methylorubrum populi]|uniref:Lytic transglycosylase n=1 Tax=Methylorubrum populi TaxID=223967 RepID=A0A160PIT3_9HYPH|nr:transglycosylase SLT domain-containing protein [Methylorubrum populi]BAU92363.1 lytic transglycosylase [Methylorubrum populi]
MRLLLAALLAAAPASAFAQEAARDNIDALIAEQARANKVPEAFVHRVVKRESNYNARAKGGSALGLMQIKHATARGLGYTGDAAGLFDPETNLKYGIAYLAGAYRAAKGDLEQAYRYYNRGYYYAAKRLGIDATPPDDAGTTTVAAAPPASPTARSANGFDGLFALRGSASGSASGSAPAGGVQQALAYAAPGPGPTDAVEVPLPPRRPAALSGSAEPVQVASLAQPAAAQLQAAVQAAAPAQPAPQGTAAPQVVAAMSDAVEVPLPPRRPSEIVLAAIARPHVAVARRTAEPAPILEASAAPGTP